MKQPNYSPQQALERVKLMMGYDANKTLTENRQSLKLIKEDDIDNDTEKSVKKMLDACNSRTPGEGTLDAASIASKFNKNKVFLNGHKLHILTKLFKFLITNQTEIFMKYIRLSITNPNTQT